MKLIRKHFQISEENKKFIKRAVIRREVIRGTSSESEVVREALYMLQENEERKDKKQ